MIVRLTRDQLSDYDWFKAVLSNEYRVTPVQIGERFFSLAKKPDETYVSLASKLQNAWMYYIRSRNIANKFDELVILIRADRLKDLLLPRRCLDWILNAGGYEEGELA